MRLLIWSVSPLAPTGYGVVCKNLALVLKDHFETGIFAFTGLRYGTIKVDNVVVMPNPSMIDHSLIMEAVKDFQPDVVLQVFDLWTTKGRIDVWDIPNLIVYSPVDGIPLAKWQRDVLSKARLVVPMCHWAKRVYWEAGVKCTDPIYHGVNTEIFYPRDKKESRRMFGIPEDAFVVLTVAVNKGDRKNFPGQLRAFYKFSRRCKDAVYALWTYPFFDKENPEGYMIPEIWELLGGEDNRLIYPDPATYLKGMPEEKLAHLYSAADVLLNCSFGEGFGLTVLEAMACGTPAIVTDFSAMPEIVGDTGWKIRPIAWYCQQFFSNWQAIPAEDEIAHCLELAYYGSSGLLKEKSQAALGRAKSFDWKKNIAPQWVKLIKSLEGEKVKVELKMEKSK